MQNPTGPEKERQLINFTFLTKFLFSSVECFHVAMEKYFEHDTSGIGKERCAKYCSFCTGGHESFAGTFRKAELIGVLCQMLFESRCPDGDKFLDELKKAKKTIYEPEAVPKLLAAPFHGLWAMLLAFSFVMVSCASAASAADSFSAGGGGG